GIQHINSLGSRRWTRFLGDLKGVTKYTFSRCSVAFISQGCLIPEVLGHGYVTSLMAPYLCDKCRHEEMRLLATAELPLEGRKLHAPRFRCIECLATLEFGDDLERYVSLVQRAQTAPSAANLSSVA